MSIEGFSQNNEDLEKQEQWEQTLKKLETVTDGLGMPIEESIKEAVVALNVNKIPTSSSCGGHIEENRLSFPHVGGEAQGEPPYRYQGEDKIIEELVTKHNLSNRSEIFSNAEIEGEYYDLVDNLDETDEYKEWYLKNKPLREQVSQLIEEFNTTRSESRVRLTPIYPGYRVEAHDRKKELPNEADLKVEIQLAQEEFRNFTEFLKHKFFTE